MKKLETIQTEQKLNDVYSIDDIGPGGAHHEYVIIGHDENPVEAEFYDESYGHIQFQCGPRKEDASVHGVIDTDLLEIVRDRLKAFQAGEFANDYNAEALEHIEAALNAMNRRVEDRIKRNVLGTYNK